ncbi:putative redox protein, regulator of disulfide bond formation [Hoeflea sp. IMCC20628]|uniref:OsmC family protein n=1 Tax=Hoeflea sp. IMCC20628 TaxID=1620421 RepID=UPI00063AF6F0|nr:OsmC family protein [Hoeflea sp. IMCC20628]AKI01923.1 putative redox protein, regulator of disulfide bond formation [Hoeflea sp. IMCC20628]
MEIRPKMTVKLRMAAKCPSHSLSELSTRDVSFVIDEPLERGGTNMGPTPTDTVIAALVGCTNTIGSKCAASLGIDAGHFHISAVCDFDRRGVTLMEEVDVPFTKIILTVEADGSASEADLQRLAEEVAKYCPVSKLFRQAGTQIEEIWKKKSV